MTMDSQTPDQHRELEDEAHESEEKTALADSAGFMSSQPHIDTDSFTEKDSGKGSRSGQYRNLQDCVRMDLVLPTASGVQLGWADRTDSRPGDFFNMLRRLPRRTTPCAYPPRKFKRGVRDLQLPTGAVADRSLVQGLLIMADVFEIRAILGFAWSLPASVIKNPKLKEDIVIESLRHCPCLVEFLMWRLCSTKNRAQPDNIPGLRKTFFCPRASLMEPELPDHAVSRPPSIQEATAILEHLSLRKRETLKHDIALSIKQRKIPYHTTAVEFLRNNPSSANRYNYDPSQEAPESWKDPIETESPSPYRTSPVLSGVATKEQGCSISWPLPTDKVFSMSDLPNYEQIEFIVRVARTCFVEVDGLYDELQRFFKNVDPADGFKELLVPQHMEIESFQVQPAREGSRKQDAVRALQTFNLLVKHVFDDRSWQPGLVAVREHEGGFFGRTRPFHDGGLKDIPPEWIVCLTADDKDLPPSQPAAYSVQQQDGMEAVSTTETSEKPAQGVGGILGDTTATASNSASIAHQGQKRKRLSNDLNDQKTGKRSLMVSLPVGTQRPQDWELRQLKKAHHALQQVGRIVDNIVRARNQKVESADAEGPWEEELDTQGSGQEEPDDTEDSG